MIALGPGTERSRIQEDSTPGEDIAGRTRGREEANYEPVVRRLEEGGAIRAGAPAAGRAGSAGGREVRRAGDRPPLRPADRRGRAAARRTLRRWAAAGSAGPAARARRSAAGSARPPATGAVGRTRWPGPSSATGLVAGLIARRSDSVHPLVKSRPGFGTGVDLSELIDGSAGRI